MKKSFYSTRYVFLDEKRKGGRERKKKVPGGGALVSQLLAAREAEKNRINEERINQVPVFHFYNWCYPEQILRGFLYFFGGGGGRGGVELQQFSSRSKEVSSFWGLGIILYSSK